MYLSRNRQPISTSLIGSEVTRPLLAQELNGTEINNGVLSPFVAELAAADFL
jgi:hypothetical protein